MALVQTPFQRTLYGVTGWGSPAEYTAYGGMRRHRQRGDLGSRPPRSHVQPSLQDCEEKFGVRVRDAGITGFVCLATALFLHIAGFAMRTRSEAIKVPYREFGYKADDILENVLRKKNELESELTTFKNDDNQAEEIVKKISLMEQQLGPIRTLLKHAKRLGWTGTACTGLGMIALCSGVIVPSVSIFRTKDTDACDVCEEEDAKLTAAQMDAQRERRVLRYGVTVSPGQPSAS